MTTRLRSIALLIVVLLIAVTLTVAMSDAILARSTFQSSPLLPTDTPVVVQPSPTAVTDGLPEPTKAPEPTSFVPVATPVGFLPAPTLTNPDALLPLNATAQPPLIGPAAAPAEPTSEPDAASGAPGVAELIDNGIIALSYVWLCCGALLVALSALVVVWLARRSSRR